MRLYLIRYNRKPLTMSFSDEFGVYDIVGDVSSPPNNRDSALSGQNRNDTSDDDVPDKPMVINGWYNNSIDHRSFYTLPYLQKDKGSTAGE